MMRLTFRQLFYFEQLAETLHFGRAAAAANVTQPALSAQIAEMENHLGITLFERGSGGVRLTNEALELRPRIQLILAEMSELRNAARRERNILEGRFRIGIIPTIAPYLLPHLLPRLKKDYPKLALEIREAITTNLIDELLLGHLDAIIAALPLNNRRLEHEMLFHDHFLLAVPDNEATKISYPVAPESLAFERLMLLEEGHCMRSDALALCSKVEPVTMSSFGATSLTTLLHMVGNGLGVTLTPELARDSARLIPGVSLLPFKAPQPSRQICLAWRQATSKRSDMRAISDVIVNIHAQLNTTVTHQD